MQGRLGKPVVEGDAVTPEIILHLLDVLGQGIGRQHLLAFLARKRKQAVAMLGNVAFRVGGDVGAVVAVLRKGNRLLTLEMLKVAGLERLGELLDLVARVVDQKLAGAAIAGPVERRGKPVADRAAPGVAHMHRPGRIGRDKFDHHLFALAVIGAAVGIPLGKHPGHNVGKPPF